MGTYMIIGYSSFLNQHLNLFMKIFTVDKHANVAYIRMKPDKNSHKYNHSYGMRPVPYVNIEYIGQNQILISEEVVIINKNELNQLQA
jgi:hypothetical protein